jgi:protein TonB
MPVLAPDVLPMPRTMLDYIVADVPPPALIDIRPAVPQEHSAERGTVRPDMAPTVAPSGIGRETALQIDRESIDDRPDGLLPALDGVGIIDAQPTPREQPEPALRPVRVSTGIKAPTRVKDVPPVYPEIARKSRVQGVVILEATIGADGRVQEARVLRSVPLLDQAAVNAVQSWEYTPTLLNGRPVPIIMTVTVKFTLE